MSVLAYPTDPTRLDYTLTPWTDTLTGKQWIWVEAKERWHQVPQWPDHVFTTSSATPTDLLLPWFDPEDGSYSVWNEIAQAWIAVSGISGVDGIDANATTVTLSTAATGATLTGTAQADETIYLKSATTAPVAAISLVLPAAANSRLGQVKTFVSSKIITALTVSVSGGGTIEGTTLSTALAYEPYSFQYVDTGVWLRLA